ncbi:hypothetical protein WJX75_004706 [Coccomyxa subellipsoidea]|uniref:Uncharacterized protein n=1 Tax=Coccomyxa subellipsoidea TaxID=248742 RepID=A0ABR2YMX1_9CHLO
MTRRSLKPSGGVPSRTTASRTSFRVAADTQRATRGAPSRRRPLAPAGGPVLGSAVSRLHRQAAPNFLSTVLKLLEQGWCSSSSK